MTGKNDLATAQGRQGNLLLELLAGEFALLR